MEEKNALPQEPNGMEGLFLLDRRDTAFAVCAVLCCILGSVFGIFEGIALGFSLFALLLLVLFTVYFAGGCRVQVFPAACGVLALLNCGVFVCTTNIRVRFCCTVLIVLLSLVWFDGLRNGGTTGNRKTLGVFYTALATVDKIASAVKSLFSNENGNKRTIGKILVGMLCAVPVLVLVIPLLISSDEAFHGMMTSLFGSARSTLIRTLLGIILSPVLMAYGFCLKKGRTSQWSRQGGRSVENVYIISFLTVICACYLLYLFSQLAYFFSAFRGFLPEGGMTYAQYARKGFFEMCVIAVINLVLVLVSLLLAKKKSGKVCGAVRILATFIGAFTLLIISTALSKMVLYISVYGMTVLRLITSAFMLFLGVVFISLILRIYITGINIVKVGLLSAGCILLILGTVNVNAVCARYNYEGYLSGRLDTVDVAAMYDLGDEGVPYLVKLASGEQGTVAREAKLYLAQTYLHRYFDYAPDHEDFTLEDLEAVQKAKGFARFSIPGQLAYESLHSYLEENPQFGHQCREILKQA